MRILAKFIASLAAIGVVVFSGTAAAQQSATQTVSIEVRAIAAGVDTEQFDSDLEDLESQLRRAFEDYSSFEQLERSERQIETGDSARVSLPTDDVLVLSNQGRDGDRVRLGLSIEDRLDTSLRATPGNTFFQAGLRYGDRMLVVAITVETP